MADVPYHFFGKPEMVCYQRLLKQSVHSCLALTQTTLYIYSVKMYHCEGHVKHNQEYVIYYSMCQWNHSMGNVPIQHLKIPHESGRVDEG